MLRKVKKSFRHFKKQAKGIRCQTISLFTTMMAITIIILSLICWIGFINAFDEIEHHSSASDIARLATLLRSDLDNLWTSVYDYSYWDESINAILLYNAGNTSAFDTYITDNFMSGEDSFIGMYMGWNMIGFYNSTHDFIWGIYQPPSSDGTIVGENRTTYPTFLTLKATIDSLTDSSSGVLNMPGYPSVFSVTVPIILEEGGEIFGTIYAARHIKEDVDDYSEVARVCITNWEHNELSGSEDALEAYNSLKDSAVSDPEVWGNISYITQIEEMNETSANGRTCPAEGEWTGGNKKLEAGYLLLRDIFAEHHPGPLLRVDHIRTDAGNHSFIVVLSLTLIAMIVIEVVFAFFLDKSVLKRLVKLNTIIEKAGDDGITSTSTSSAGKSRSGSDEVNHLKHNLRDKLASLAKELQANNQSIAAERDRAERIQGALRLLNLWCGQHSTTQTLEEQQQQSQPASSPQMNSATPNAALISQQNRTTPNIAVSPKSTLPTSPLLSPNSELAVDLHQVLEDFIAVEFLKAHCLGESTSENISFLLDLRFRKQQLAELERRGTSEEDIKKLRNAWDSWLHKEYFTSESQHAINVGAEALHNATVNENPSYDLAQTEVEHLMGSDVLPRFQASPLFRAMQRAVAHEQGASVEQMALKPPDASKIYRVHAHKRQQLGHSTSNLTEEEVRSELK